MSSAIVTGATGILGREIVKALGNDSKQWPLVHALSRSQKEEYPPNVKHDHIDLTSSAEDLARQLDGVEAEYLFFAAYLERSTEQENLETNGAMLRNFLQALNITGAERKLKRVILTTGAKQYGVHLGPGKNPMEENDPWVEGPDRPPNFYYEQQRILRERSKDVTWDWVVTYPNDVIGFAKGNFMNLATSLGFYAVVNKEMGKPLLFPGSKRFYTGFDVFTYSKLHAAFNLWAALEPRAGNQAFNVVNGDVESWQNLWPRLVERFGCEIPKDMFSAMAPDECKTKLCNRPPIADVSERSGLGGHIEQGVLEQRIDLVKWSQRDDVKRAWAKLAEREKLDQDAFQNATWGFLGFVLGRNYDIVLNMTKARDLGWTGYIGTWEAIDQTFAELEEAGILPRAK